jgi:hypothetical protein
LKAGVDVARLLGEAAELSQQAASLAAQGGVDEALELERRADRLRNAARRAAGIKRGITREPASTSPSSADTRIDVGAERGESARAVTISALGEIGVPISPRAVAEYALARYGTKIDHRALPSLRRDEWRAWSSPRANRAVYVVPALEGHRFLAVRGKIALSEWPLERRLIGPWSERADHLAATIQLARQLSWLSRVEPSAAERLRSLVATYAVTVQGAVSDSEALDPKKVEDAAQAELDVIGGRDVEWREEAAQRARGFLNDEQLLWGAPPPRLVHRA